MQEKTYKNIETIRVVKVDDLVQLFKFFEFEEDKKRTRSSFLFRGISSTVHPLITSLERFCGKKKEVLEKPMLRNFTKYAIGENRLIGDSVWHQLIIGQHHGLPTRMMDWTYSPLMALHFALSESDPARIGSQDCEIWAVSVKEMITLLPLKYQIKLKEENAFCFTIDMLRSLANDLSEYDKDMENVFSSEREGAHSAMVFMEPPSIDQRIVNQYSYFSIVPSHIDRVDLYFDETTRETKRIIIDKSIHWETRDMLDSMNINERIVYPGLDGIATWLRRHYYVK